MVRSRSREWKSNRIRKRKSNRNRKRKSNQHNLDRCRNCLAQARRVAKHHLRDLRFIRVSPAALWRGQTPASWGGQTPAALCTCTTTPMGDLAREFGSPLTLLVVTVVGWGRK